MFLTLVIEQLVRSFAARSFTRTFFEVGAFQNLWLLLVVGVTLLAQLAIHQVPFTQELFGIRALGLEEWAICCTAGLVPVTIIEVSKLVRRALLRQRHKHDKEGATVH